MAKTLSLAGVVVVALLSAGLSLSARPQSAGVSGVSVNLTATF
jgi:hypothetical protein